MGDLHDTNIKPSSPSASTVRSTASTVRPAVDETSGRPDLDTALREYADTDFCPMHMPGHKRKSADEIRDMLYSDSPADLRDLAPVSGALPPFPVEHMDITEIDGFDNLHRPEGLIADIESGLADLYHVPAAKLSVGGSTVGLLSAITAVTRPDDHIIIARNCHAAVYHAALVQGLEVDYLLPQPDGSIAAETVAEAFENKALARMINASADGELQDILEKHSLERPADSSESSVRSGLTREMNHPEQQDSDADHNRIQNVSPYKAVILTCPTYEGVMSDITAIAKIVHSHGAVLIVDAAHGAHLGISGQEIFPENPIHCGADIAIVSLHKTLPALTMTAAILLARPAVSGNPEGNASGKAGTGGAMRTLPSCVPTEGDAGGKAGTGGAKRTLPSCVPTEEDASGKAGTGGQIPTCNLLPAVAAALDIYETSSPSYVLMASVARMLRLLKTDGERLFAEYADRLKKFYADAAVLKDPAVLPYFGRDPSKIVIVSKNDIINRLRDDYHIELEMASLTYALAMTSIADSDENFGRLLAALVDMNARVAAAGGQSVRSVQQKFVQPAAHLPGRETDEEISSGSRSALAGFPGGVFTLDMPFTSENYELPEQVSSIRTAYFADAENVRLEESIGRISAAFVSVFPPEIPVLVPGERIGEPEVRLLQAAAARGFTVHGMEDGRIKVVK
ncbi:MAG: hypothetical protein VZQ80_05390 [Lachnospiraceae bacterium]|nr:hypothetical protein [Lachnospiraceae bacterium]